MSLYMQTYQTKLPELLELEPGIQLLNADTNVTGALHSLVLDHVLTTRSTGSTPTGTQPPNRSHASTTSGDLTTLRTDLTTAPAIVDTQIVDQRVGFRHDSEPVLKLSLASIEDVRPIARSIRDYGAPGEYRVYNVDFSREFRYCLEQAVDPTPSHDLHSLTIHIPETTLANGQLDTIALNDNTHAGSRQKLIAELQHTLTTADPDVLRVNTAEVVPFLYEQAATADRELELGRRPGYQQLAGGSTYESYGQVGHSPARYNVPGRVIVDESNTFFYDESNLAGCLDLVSRSHKPPPRALVGVHRQRPHRHPNPQSP